MTSVFFNTAFLTSLDPGDRSLQPKWHGSVAGHVDHSVKQLKVCLGIWYH